MCACDACILENDFLNEKINVGRDFVHLELIGSLDYYSLLIAAISYERLLEGRNYCPTLTPVHTSSDKAFCFEGEDKLMFLFRYCFGHNN